MLTPDIFDALRETEPGAGGEIQLTDAINLLAKEQAVYAYKFDHGRYDVGNKLDYLKATVEFALERDDVGDDFRALPAGSDAATTGSGSPLEASGAAWVDCRAWLEAPPRPRSRRRQRAALRRGCAEDVLAQIHPLASLQLPLTEAYGCVAAEDVVAERDLPEFASSAMDGFAVRSSDVAGAVAREARSS